MLKRFAVAHGCVDNSLNRNILNLPFYFPFEGGGCGIVKLFLFILLCLFHY